MKSTVKRKTYFDIIRLIAIFFVLYAHTDRLAVHHYLVEGGQASYWIALFLQQFMYVNTSLFFMMSGALLLHKQESLKEIFKKRVLKYVVIIVVFDFIQYCYNYYNNPEIGFDIGIIFKRMYATSMITQYWYLYAYLVFLMILPFLRTLVQNMSELLGKYLIIGFILLNGVMPIIEILWENDRLVLEVPLFVNIIVFPILGYYLEHYWFEKLSTAVNLIWVNVLSVIAWTMNVWYSYARMQDGAYYLVADGLTMVLVIVIYLDIRAICEAIRKKREASGNGDKVSAVSRVLAVMGKGTFVVYLLEPELREGFQFIYDDLYLSISWLPATVLWLIAAMLVGILISFVWEMIKLLLGIVFVKLSRSK